LIPAERYRELMRSAPPVDDDFAADLRDIRDAVAPAEGSWPS
jgi:hypothetical protein